MRFLAILAIFSLLGLSCSKDPCAGAKSVVRIGQLASSSSWAGFSSWREEVQTDHLKNISDKERCYKYVDNLKDADIVVSGTKEAFDDYLASPPPAGQKFLIWTDEPRLNIGRDKIVDVKGFKIPVYDNWTEKLLFNNYYFLDLWVRRGIFSPNPLPLATAEMINFKKRKTVIVAGYADDTYHTRNYVPEDLALPRQNIALWGHDHNKVIDIFGTKWPAGIAQAESRSDSNWEDKKFKIVQEYMFNLAFENTNVQYYVTEKIWDAIRAYSLPIYYGNEWIYEDFPKNSFIDYNDFGTPQKLFDFINSMSDDEWVRRLNLCIDTYNKSLHIVKTTDVFRERDALIKRVLESL
jgi:hypothetical protein